MRHALLIGLLAFAWGCGTEQVKSRGPSDPPPLRAEKPADPEHKLYEQVRSGTVQLGGGSDDIEEALRAVEGLLKTVPKENKDALTDAKALIDSAGAGIADYTEEVPEFEQFKNRLAEFDDQRLKAIQETNDSIHDLREAKGIVESLEGSGTGNLTSQLEDLAALIDVAISDLSDAVTTMGGTVEQEQ